MPKSDTSGESKSERTSNMSDTSQFKETQKNKMDELFDGQSLRTNPFGDNVIAEQGYFRTERIAAAVHLMTSHMELDEPLRNTLRSDSINLLEAALQLQSELRASGSENVRKMYSLIRKLISLVRLAGVSGRVSNQNARILVDALDELGNFYNSAQRSTLAEAFPLRREDLIPRPEAAKKDMRNTQVYSKRTSPIRSLKDGTKKDIVRNNASQESRSVRILDILNKGGLLGIKDIVAQLPEYSEKMVQRDLASMAEAGQVRKIGEKRWSKYEVVR